MLSKVDDKVTPLRLLDLFFNNVLVDMIVGYTKLYSHREKADISYENTNENIHLLLSMLLLSGCHKLLDCKMYWETILDTFMQAKFDSMLVISGSVFFGIFIFDTTNNLISKTNSRSSFPWLLSQVGKSFQQFLFQQIEQIYRMIPCNRTHGSRQWMNNKLFREEYKI